MQGSFLDTNIIIYSFSNDEEKQSIALSLLAQKPIVSVQVLSETANVMRKKMGFDLSSIRTILDRISDECSVVEPITLRTLQNGLDLSEQYLFSHYDSLIIASALQSNCHTVYSEDMQHKQQINNQLTIINPFITTSS